MRFSIGRETILRPLQMVISVVERRQTLPVLSNLLLVIEGNRLSITATDLEVEVSVTVEVESAEEGEITVPARKFVDICRALPEEATLKATLDEDHLKLRAGRSRFSLATLAAVEFPIIEEVAARRELALSVEKLKELISRTHFCMAQQDVRYYLNGLMLELAPGHLRAVATDGHRLAVCDVEEQIPVEGIEQVIVPRKGVQELLRLLGESEGEARVVLGQSHVRVELPQIRFTSKLIDGKFPDYQRVLPQDSDKRLVIDRRELTDALVRTSILSNEKYRGIRFVLEPERITVQAHNPEKEEAEEELAATFEGEQMEIGFNVGYVLDALNAISTGEVEMQLRDSNSSCLIKAPESEACRYVVMPMRL